MERQVNTNSVTNPLLDPKGPESPESIITSETDECILKQNQAISQEVARYDQLLSTRPMYYYKIWIFFFAVVRMVNLIKLFNSNMASLDVIPPERNYGYYAAWPQSLGHLIIIVESFMIEIALWKKDLKTMEKSILILIIGICLLEVSYGIGLVYLFDGLRLVVILVELGLMLLTFLWPAIYARKILRERQPFYQISILAQYA